MARKGNRKPHMQAARPRQQPQTAAREQRTKALLAEVQNLIKKGTGHHSRREFPAATQCYRKALTIQPVNTTALNNLGLIRKELGEPRVAEELIRMAVNLRPRVPDFHFNLGNAIRDDGRFPGAINEYKIALKLDPKHFRAWLNLGDCQRILGEYEAAEESFTAAAKLQPDDLNVKLNFANLLLEMGKGEQAAASYQELIKINPKDARYYSNCGAAYKQTGNLKESAECFRKAVELNPDMIGAVFNVVSLDKIEAGDSWFDFLNKLKQNPRLSIHEKAGVFFSLGKMYHDIKEYDESFSNYREGNALRDQISARLGRTFSRESYRKHMDAIMKAYPREQFKKMRPAGELGDDEYTPIIVFGMPRSGTTLTETILGSHPMVKMAGELPDLGDLSRVIDDRENKDEQLPFPQNVEVLTPERAVALARRYLARLREMCGDAPRVTDKMPGNFNYLGFIAHLFPAAKLIDCRRDPVDNCLSCYMQNFSRRHEYSNDLGHLAFVYKEYERLMDFWNENLPIPIYRSQYEDLVENHEDHVRKLLDFCGLDWNDKVLEFHKTKRNVQTASVLQVRQPLYTSAIQRWKKYEKHLKPLLDGLSLKEQPESTVTA